MDRRLTLPNVTSLNAVCPCSSAILKKLSGGVWYVTPLFVPRLYELARAAPIRTGCWVSSVRRFIQLSAIRCKTRMTRQEQTFGGVGLSQLVYKP
jgi:hypothetical protein